MNSEKTAEKRTCFLLLFWGRQSNSGQVCPYDDCLMCLNYDS